MAATIREHLKKRKTKWNWHRWTKDSHRKNSIRASCDYAVEVITMVMHEKKKGSMQAEAACLDVRGLLMSKDTQFWTCWDQKTFPVTASGKSDGANTRRTRQSWQPRTHTPCLLFYTSEASIAIHVCTIYDQSYQLLNIVIRQNKYNSEYFWFKKIDA